MTNTKRVLFNRIGLFFEVIGIALIIILIMNGSLLEVAFSIAGYMLALAFIIIGITFFFNVWQGLIESYQDRSKGSTKTVKLKTPKGMYSLQKVKRNWIPKINLPNRITPRRHSLGFMSVSFVVVIIYMVFLSTIYRGDFSRMIDVGLYSLIVVGCCIPLLIPFANIFLIFFIEDFYTMVLNISNIIPDEITLSVVYFVSFSYLIGSYCVIFATSVVALANRDYHGDAFKHPAILLKKISLINPK